MCVRVGMYVKVKKKKKKIYYFKNIPFFENERVTEAYL